MDETGFGFDAAHILLAALGASLRLSCRLPYLFTRRPPAATALLMACGLVELVEGYGFIAAFVAEVACRQVDARHRSRQQLHAFANPIEHAITAIPPVLLGSVMPTLRPHLDWGLTLIGFGLIRVIRPRAGLVGRPGSPSSLRARAVVALYGVRGIGSLSSFGYASSRVEFVDEGQLWAVVSFTIFASTVIQGLTATATVETPDRAAAEGRG